MPVSVSDCPGPDLPVFGEHREVCAFLMGLMAGWPEGDPFTWLDLGCGEMRVLDAARHALFDKHRARIRYVGYDRAEPSLEACRRLSGCGFARWDVLAGDLSELRVKLGSDWSGFRLITLTNTLHEVEPEYVAGLLCDCLTMLEPCGGVFLAFDVEWLKEPESEPGSATWSSAGIAQVIEALFEGLGWPPQEAVARWRTHSTTGWTVIVSREAEGEGDRAAAREAMDRAVREALRDRRDECARVLKEYADRRERTAVGNGIDSLRPDEKAEVQRNLWLHYGLSRFSSWIDAG